MRRGTLLAPATAADGRPRPPSLHEAGDGEDDGTGDGGLDPVDLQAVGGVGVRHRDEAEHHEHHEGDDHRGLEPLEAVASMGVRDDVLDVRGAEPRHRGHAGEPEQGDRRDDLAVVVVAEPDAADQRQERHHHHGVGARQAAHLDRVGQGVAHDVRGTGGQGLGRGSHRDTSWVGFFPPRFRTG